MLAAGLRPSHLRSAPVSRNHLDRRTGNHFARQGRGRLAAHTNRQNSDERSNLTATVKRFPLHTRICVPDFGKHREQGNKSRNPSATRLSEVHAVPRRVPRGFLRGQREGRLTLLDRFVFPCSLISISIRDRCKPHSHWVFPCSLCSLPKYSLGLCIHPAARLAAHIQLLPGGRVQGSAATKKPRHRACQGFG